MAKIFYVTEKTDDYTTAHFFKTEKEALAYGISEWSDFDMFGDPDSEDDSYDKDNDVWFEGDSINTRSGILFSFEEGRAYLQSSDDEEAREYVQDKLGEYGSAIFFDGFKKGMYGYLGTAADGKHYKWDWDGDEINESFVNEARYNKKSLLKKLGKADDARIQTGNGKEYIIYNPDSNNDDNAAMWNDDSVFALDQDGEEHEIAYKDIGLVMVESVVTEKFNFSKKEVESAANLIASAISQADKVKAKVHDLEYVKGRGAGFEISIDGEKYDGGSYVVKDNGDVVNAAIGNKHPNAVYNTIGNKDIVDVFINMEKYESLANEANEQTVKEVTATRKKVLMFEEFVLGGDCKCGGNCTCTTTTTNEAKAISAQNEPFRVKGINFTYTEQRGRFYGAYLYDVAKTSNIGHRVKFGLDEVQAFLKSIKITDKVPSTYETDELDALCKQIAKKGIVCDHDDAMDIS